MDELLPRKARSTQASATGIARARELRRESSVPERRLWSRLRSGSLAGLKFRRQVPIGVYVVDFCCLEKRLVIELDGDSHAGREVYDAGRTAYLEGQGFRVLRINNRDVCNDPTATADHIARELGIVDLDWKAP